MQIVTVQDETTPLLIENPKIEVYKDCVFAPMRLSSEHGGSFWANHHWGVYDQDGNLVPGAAFSYLPNFEISGQNEICLHEISNISYAPTQQYFYVGNLINHYGHFLCSSMARAWALSEINLNRVPLLGHSEGPPFHWFKHYSFFRPLFGAVGVSQEDFAHFEKPVRIRELIVAHPAMVERNLIHKVYAQTMNTVGDRLTKGLEQPRPRNIVYLSKAQHFHSSQGLLNETEITDYMEAEGVSVVSPEQLPIAEQIALFRSTRCIIGQCGSAMHTSVFVRPRSDQVMISLIDKPQCYSSNAGMIDAANGSRTIFVYCEGETIGGGPARRLLNPQQAARDMLALARSQ
ncbi:glycosyltransferase family 61 protein [Methylobacterium sp. J-090]|uniref:glycosyltransferase family 61 protein n=1 Tax=Methylobacterium sp. J-090 TaxID=2836666 RepID=UPI001FBB7878|nr:glycosyltransferase family 61 protein [Methylobacterium sp. J-090]MCJ2082774.1 glycosyltransferase family 61 protein [Methylobacterium sp. J-090]